MNMLSSFTLYTLLLATINMFFCGVTYKVIVHLISESETELPLQGCNIFCTGCRFEGRVMGNECLRSKLMSDMHRIQCAFESQQQSVCAFFLKNHLMF